LCSYPSYFTASSCTIWPMSSCKAWPRLNTWRTQLEWNGSLLFIVKELQMSVTLIYWTLWRFPRDEMRSHALFYSKGG
jgi:hypothetical protein